MPRQPTHVGPGKFKSFSPLHHAKVAEWLCNRLQTGSGEFDSLPLLLLEIFWLLFCGIGVLAVLRFLLGGIDVLANNGFFLGGIDVLANNGFFLGGSTPGCCRATRCFGCCDVGAGPAPRFARLLRSLLRSQVLSSVLPLRG